MKLRRIIFPALILLLSISSLDAQSYRTAIGARFEEEGVGLSVAQRLGKKVTVEGIIIDNQFAERQGYLLLKRHYGLFNRRLNAYMGAGLHTGFSPDAIGTSGYDFVGGAEFTVLRITIAADVKPEFAFGTNEFIGMNPSISLRYSLFRDRSNRNCGRRNRW